jgi:hypothetical protein
MMHRRSAVKTHPGLTGQRARVATRALSGIKVVNLGALSEERHREVAAGCELAVGQVYYWVRRVER